MNNRVYVFAYNYDEKADPWRQHKGFFDGDDFIPKLGFCSSIDELYEYDCIQLFGPRGCSVSSPKKFNKNKNLQEEMKRIYVKEFGEDEQINLFG